MRLLHNYEPHPNPLGDHQQSILSPWTDLLMIAHNEAKAPE